MVNPGDRVVWVDRDVARHDAVVDKVKKNNLIDLHFMNNELGRDTYVYDAAHKNLHDDTMGDYWVEA